MEGKLASGILVHCRCRSLPVGVGLLSPRLHGYTATHSHTALTRSRSNKWPLLRRAAAAWLHRANRLRCFIAVPVCWFFSLARHTRRANPTQCDATRPCFPARYCSHEDYVLTAGFIAVIILKTVIERRLSELIGTICNSSDIRLFG